MKIICKADDVHAWCDQMQMVAWRGIHCIHRAKNIEESSVQSDLAISLPTESQTTSLKSVPLASWVVVIASKGSDSPFVVYGLVTCKRSMVQPTANCLESFMLHLQHSDRYHTHFVVRNLSNTLAVERQPGGCMSVFSTATCHKDEIFCVKRQ